MPLSMVYMHDSWQELQKEINAEEAAASAASSAGQKRATVSTPCKVLSNPSPLISQEAKRSKALEPEAQEEDTFLDADEMRAQLASMMSASPGGKSTDLMETPKKALDMDPYLDLLAETPQDPEYGAFCS